jgi:hypothetical protein
LRLQIKVSSMADTTNNSIADIDKQLEQAKIQALTAANPNFQIRLADAGLDVPYTKLEELSAPNWLKICYKILIDDTPLSLLNNRSDYAERFRKYLGSMKLEEIQESLSSRKDFINYLAYSDYKPSLVHVKDVQLLAAKSSFEHKVTTVLGIAHIFYLYRNRWRRSRSIAWGLTRYVTKKPSFFTALLLNLAFRLMVETVHVQLTKGIERQVLDKFDLTSQKFKLGYEYMISTDKLAASSNEGKV